MEAEINPLETIRELATHANDIKHLQDDMDKMVRDMDEIKRAIKGIEASLSEAKGGARVLVVAMGVASFFGGVAMWVLDRFFGK